MKHLVLIYAEWFPGILHRERRRQQLSAWLFCIAVLSFLFAHNKCVAVCVWAGCQPCGGQVGRLMVRRQQRDFKVQRTDLPARVTLQSG